MTCPFDVFDGDRNENILIENHLKGDVDEVHEDLSNDIMNVLLEQTTTNDNQAEINEIFIATIKKKKECCFNKLLPYIKDINFCEGNMAESPLHHAAREGNKNIVNQLLKVEGINVNKQSSSKTTPLHLAAQEGHYKIVKILLNAGADPLMSDKKSRIPLHFAAEKGKDISCKTLTKDIPNAYQQMRKQNAMGDTALIEAAKNGNKLCCEYLISENIDIKNKMNNTALHCAAQKAYTATVKYLLSQNANYKFKNNLGNTAAHQAATLHNKTTLTELIEHDPSFYYENCIANDKGRNLLHAASNSIECLTYLLEFNSTIINNCDIFNETPLHLAIKAKNAECAEKLLEYDTKLSIVNNESKTVLHLAVEKNLPTVCKKILTKDRSIIDFVDDKNSTALHIAAYLSSIDCCGIILKKRPRLDATDGNGKSPLHIAAANGNSLICKCLIIAKVPLNSKDDLGNSVLHSSASEGQLECTKLLLKYGKFLIKERNKKDQLALDVAFEKKDDEVFEYLLSITPFVPGNVINTKVHDFMHTALNEKRRYD